MKSNTDNIQFNPINRILILHDYVDTLSIAKINNIILNIISDDNEKEKKEKDFKRQPIKFYINTRGGYVDDTLSLINIMLKSPTPIYTYCTGFAYSCGFFLFLAGEKRFICEGSNLMYHQISSGTYGMLKEMCDDVARLVFTQEKLDKYILSRTSISKSVIEKVNREKTDWYIDYKEALQHKVATDILNFMEV